MRTSIKTLQNISGLPDLKTYTGSVRKSAKPDLPTTAILDLYMRRNERDRITSELKRLVRRRTQLKKRLTEVKKEMVKLLGKATKTAEEIGGSTAREERHLSKGSEKKGRMVLGY